MNHPAHTEPHRPTTPGLKPKLGALCGLAVSVTSAHAAALSVEGVHVVPHVQSAEMRYRQKPDFSLGARVEVFLRNTSQKTLAIPATTAPGGWWAAGRLPPKAGQALGRG